MKFFLGLWLAKIYYRFFEKNKESDRMGVGALKIDEDFLYHIKKPELIIAVTGTNGKTTTSNMLYELFTKAGHKVAFNSDGCNMRPGLCKAFILNTTIFGKPKCDVAILEIDELLTKQLLDATKPDYVVCTNLFKDTMGRNGHTDYIFNKINEGLPKNSTLILNADDLISSRLGNGNKKKFFSIEKQIFEKSEKPSYCMEMKICPKCYKPLEYDFIRYEQLGKAHCPNCGFKNFDSDYTITDIDFEKMNFTCNNEQYPIVNDSIFNVYNQLAALAVCKECGITNVKETFAKQEIVKSRLTTETIKGIEIVSQMAKGQNPASMSRAFNYVVDLDGTKEIIIFIDDIFDRKSTERSEVISYIYDVDYECFNKPEIKRIILGGERALDYKVRMMFAGIDEEKIIVCDTELGTVDHLKFDCDKVIVVNDMSQERMRNEVKEAIKEALK